MNKQLVTIGIPSYNHAKYIIKCLDSVKDDSYTNKEILIVDDGSSDNSVEIIREWQSKNPSINSRLLIKKNRGINAAFNDIINNAEGEYICILASDDAFMPDSIKIRLKVFEERPEKLAVIGDAVVINEDNKIIMESAIVDLYKGDKSNYTTDDLLLYSVVKQWSVPGPVLMVKKSLYNIIGLYPEKQFAEDINFYMKVIGLKLLAFVDQPVAQYRVHQTNTGGNPKFAKQLSMAFIKAYISNIKYYPLKLQLIILKRLMGRIYLYLKAVAASNT